MQNDFLHPVSYEKLKPISYDMAKEIVNTEVDLEKLLLAIYKQVLSGKLPISKFANKKFFKEGKNPIGELKKGKVAIVCPFHDTENDDSTSVLKGKKRTNNDEGKPDLIKCFTGGCTAIKVVNPIYVHMILVLGVDPKVIGSPAAKTEYGKAIYGLSNFLGYKIVKSGGRRRFTKEERKRFTIQNILNDTTDLYHEEFLKNDVAKEYFLETRGFKYGVKDPMSILKTYKIGFAPDEFPSNWLFKKLEPKYKTEEMIEASVVKWVEFKEENGEVKEANPYDFHSDALIIPYWSKGKVIKHYSRGINAPKKWRHMRAAGTSDEPLNIHEGARYENVNIIEGEISWLSMISLDYDNSLATYGTNGLSEEHAKMLLKIREESNGAFCKTIYIVYDGDKPGRDATVITGKLLVENGFDVRVVMLPEGMDPNDILVKYKEEAKAIMDKLYSEAVSYYTFLALNSISKDFTSTSDRLAEMNKIKETIAEHGITDPTQLYLVAKEFAEIAKIPVEVVWESWKPKENKNVEVFSSEKFAFITKDLEGYFLTKMALKGRAAYVEDETFSFIREKEITVKSIVVDEKFYDDKEKESIKEFCSKNNVKYLAFYDFKTICEVNINSQTLIDSLLKN